MIRAGKIAWNNVPGSYNTDSLQPRNLEKVASNESYSTWKKFGVYTDGNCATNPNWKKIRIVGKYTDNQEVFFDQVFECEDYCSLSAGVHDAVNHGAEKNFDVWCEVEPGCENDSDCPEGEQCVDGECVPCPDGQATHFKVYWESAEANLLDNFGNLVTRLASNPIPITGAYDVDVGSPSLNTDEIWVRIVFCDSSGKAKNYKTSSNELYVIDNPHNSFNNAITAFSGFEGSNIVSDKWKTNLMWDGFGAECNLLVTIPISESIPVCDDDEDPEEPLPPEPFPPDPPEPDDPPDDDEPDVDDEPASPIPPIPPDEPESCECEKYIGKQISYAIQKVGDRLEWVLEKLNVNLKNHSEIQTTDLNNFKNQFKVLFENLFENLAFNIDEIRKETIKIREQVTILQGRFLSEEEINIADIHDEVFHVSTEDEKEDPEYRKNITDLVDEVFHTTEDDPVNITDLIDEVFHSTENPEMNITDVIENQPVPIIENEYRVSSERSVDFLDAYNDNQTGV